MRHGSIFLLVCILIGWLAVDGCTPRKPRGFIGKSATPVSIALSPQNLHATLGNAQQFRLIGTYADGHTKDLTDTASWASSNSAVITISSSGLAQMVSIGSGTITAASGQLSASASVQVAMALTQPSNDLLYSFAAGFDIGGLDATAQGKVYTLARNDLGLDYLKASFKWDEIDPNHDSDPANWNWAAPDIVAQYAEANHLSIIPFFSQENTPGWAQKAPLISSSLCSGGITSITSDPSYFANYVYQFVKKYKTQMSIQYIELENEPNGQCLWPDTPQYLAEVDNAVLSLVKAYDSAIHVCTASFHQPLGLPLNTFGYPTNLAEENAYSASFLRDYLASLAPGFDCFSLHDYGRLGFTETDSTYPYTSQYELENNYKTALISAGLTTMDIIFTECAYDRDLFGGDERYAAGQMLQGYILTHAKGIAQGRFCQALSGGALQTTSRYGITDIVGSSPQYYAGFFAFQTLRNIMTRYPVHSQHVAGLTNDDGYWVEKFTTATGSDTLLVAFVPIRYDASKGLPISTPPASQTATISIGLGKTALVTTMMGTATSMTADSVGTITLDVSSEPVFVEIL